MRTAIEGKRHGTPASRVRPGAKKSFPHHKTRPFPGPQPAPGGIRSPGSRLSRQCFRACQGRRPGRTAHLGRAHLARPAVVRPGRDAGHDHAVHGDVRAARRHGEADAGQPARAEPRRVVDGVARRPHLRVRPAQGRQVPQRRARHRRGREVLLRALSRHLGQGDQGPGGRDRDARSAEGALQAQGAVARLPHVLCERHRGRLDRAEEVRGEGGRRGLQEGADRRRPLQVRLVHSGRGADAGGLRPVLAQDAERQAPGVQGDPRRVDAAGRPQAGRGRHRLLDPRRARRGAAAHAGAHPQARRHPGHRSGSTSPSSGTRSRHGTTSACGWRRASPSTARPSTRR